MACRAASVGMLVYMDVASLVKRSAPQGRESCSMLFLMAKESSKYDDWLEHLVNPFSKTMWEAANVGADRSSWPFSI